MKKITRKHAIDIFYHLGSMALGHMDEKTLTVVIDNCEKSHKVQEDFQKLSEELSKRLYEGMDEEKKKEYFEIVDKYQKANAEDKKDYEALMDANYHDFYVLYKKHIAVLQAMQDKKIEIDFAEVDKKEFITGVLLGKNRISVNEMEYVFAPMFKATEKKEADISELDELLKD